MLENEEKFINLENYSHHHLDHRSLFSAGGTIQSMWTGRKNEHLKWF